MELTPDRVPTLPHILGPPFVSFILSSLLYGGCLASWVTYMQFSYPTEGKRTRKLMWAVAFAATMSMLLSLMSNMRKFAYRFGRAPNTDDAKWESMTYICGGVTHALVGGFFALRAYRMYGQKLYMAIGFCLVFFVTLVGAIGAAVAHIVAPFGQRTELDMIFNYILFIGQMTGDGAVTLLIIFKLLKSKTGWKHTDSTISKLIIIGIETQLPPTLMAVAFLIVFIAAPFRTYILAFTCYPMLFTLCFLASLNTRYTLSASMSSEKREVVLSKRSGPPSIRVTTETYTYSGQTGQSSSDSSSKRPVGRAGGRPVDSTESFDGQEDVAGVNTSEIRLV